MCSIVAVACHKFVFVWFVWTGEEFFSQSYMSGVLWWFRDACTLDVVLGYVVDVYVFGCVMRG